MISDYFVKYLPLALGLSLAGGGFGNFLFPWITKILVAEFGWRGLYDSTDFSGGSK